MTVSPGRSLKSQEALSELDKTRTVFRKNCKVPTANKCTFLTFVLVGDTTSDFTHLPIA